MSISFKGSGGGGKGGYDPSGVTATPADVLQGKSFMAKDGSMQAGAIPLKGAATITPTTSEQKIDAGQYLSGDQTIAAVKLQSKSTSVSAGSGKYVRPDSGYTGLSQVYVSSPAVSAELTWKKGSFETGSRTRQYGFDCGVSNPKAVVILGTNVATSSDIRWYLASLFAYGSGLSTGYANFGAEDRVDGNYGPFQMAEVNGTNIVIDLSVIDDTSYFDGDAIYEYWVGY
jgi:hypothetical protein